LEWGKGVAQLPEQQVTANEADHREYVPWFDPRLIR
jgi:hypothetical protein